MVSLQYVLKIQRVGFILEPLLLAVCHIRGVGGSQARGEYLRKKTTGIAVPPKKTQPHKQTQTKKKLKKNAQRN